MKYKVSYMEIPNTIEDGDITAGMFTDEQFRKSVIIDAKNVADAYNSVADVIKKNILRKGNLFFTTNEQIDLGASISINTTGVDKPDIIEIVADNEDIGTAYIDWNVWELTN